jgi:hypothetical protein
MRDQERSLWLHHAVAGHLVQDPERVLTQAGHGLLKLREVHRDGVVTASLDEWGTTLAAGPDLVLQVLTSRDPRAVELRQNSPFAGVLSPEERRAVLTAFRQSWRGRTAAA